MAKLMATPPSGDKDALAVRVRLDRAPDGKALAGRFEIVLRA